MTDAAGASGGSRPAWLDRAAAALFAPRDAAALAVFRMLFGLIGLVSALRFLAYGWVDQLFVAPRVTFHYWGAAWIKPLGSAGMHAVFAALAVLSACVALGLLYRAAIVLYVALFTYVQLIDVTSYLNHYYLVSLLGALMALMPLHATWSIDARLLRGVRRDALPAWCTYLLRFQVGTVYTFAGLAKVNEDWLIHAQPLQIWLAARTDTPLIGPLLTQPWAAHAMSWAGCLFDLTIAFWLLLPRTRPFAYAAVLVFHALTKLLFPIGMFPFIMIVAAAVFFSPSWPRRFLPGKDRALSGVATNGSTGTREAESRSWSGKGEAPSLAPALPAPRWFKPALAVAAVYMALQLFLPFRTHLYGGNVRWHEQGMRFSWRVMLREKNGSVTYRVTDPRTGRVSEVPPRKYLDHRQERDFSSQPDLILQLAHRIADDFEAREGVRPIVRVDALVSLNGRRPARLIDPDIDLARTTDSLAPAAWILPAPTEPPPVIRPIAWKSASR